MRHDQIALQLYTVRRLSAGDLPGTLQAVTDAGFRNVELAGLPALRPGELGRRLREAGLRAVASHEGMTGLRADPLAVADRLADAGCDRIVVPSLPDEDRRTVDDVRRFAGELGRLAGQLAERGFRLAYHNHDFEFAPLGGTTAWDVLLAELPAGVDIELDVYWVAVAGRDPVTEIRAVADRLRLLHMKDMDAGPDRRDCAPGQGILAFPEIVAAGRAAGVEWYVAELDDTRDPLADIASAARYLGSLAAGGVA